MGKIKSRAKGNAYECKLAKAYREVGFPDCVTSRSESKRLDDKGVDLCFTKPFNVQAKCYKQFPVARAIETINYMEENTNDENYNICHVFIKSPIPKIRSKSIEGETKEEKKMRIKKEDELLKKERDRRGSVVIIKEEDWFEIIQMLKSNNIV